MRIAFVAQPFDRMDPPVRGGSLSMWIYYMARLCAKQGHDVTILGNHGKTFSTRTTKHEGVNYIFTSTGLDRLLNKVFESLPAIAGIPTAAAAPLFGSDWHHRGYAVEVARKVRKLKCDVVHVMNYSQFVPVIRKFNPHCRIALHMQCEWLTQLDPSLVRERLDQTDLVIGCSEYITRKIALHFPDYANRCVTVPNAADVVPEHDASSLDTETVLFVGRLSPEKGVHDLIRAFHHVLKVFPDARLRLVGGAGSAPVEYMVGVSDDPLVTALRVFYPEKKNGSKDPYLEALEQEAGAELGSRIIFEGRADHNQIETFYREAAVLVNPSLSESFGISLVEAMMHCVPVVATRTGGMTYTVDPGRTGYLVDPANPQELADKICAVLADGEKAREMGRAGRARAIEKFSWEKTTDLLLENYRALLN